MSEKRKELKIFLSWSGERSRRVAELLRDWLPLVLESEKVRTIPWLSQDSIAKGGSWVPEIMESLKNHTIGIFCLTPENYQEPWVIFEAGALWKAKDNSKVCPLLLDLRPEELKGPLAEFQSTIFERSDFFKLLKTLNNELGDDKIESGTFLRKFENQWNDLHQKVAKIAAIANYDLKSNLYNLIKTFINSGFPKPRMGKHAYFESGFESHILYNTISKLASKRLYIFGRKNRKLFDKEHYDFFKNLREKLNEGFDLKILFLNPEAPEEILNFSHRSKNFKKQLIRCIDNASDVMDDFKLKNFPCCRQYDVFRTVATIIVDDAVIYSPILLDETGRVKSLTKAPFNIVSANSHFGKELIENFLGLWEKSVEI